MAKDITLYSADGNTVYYPKTVSDLVYNNDSGLTVKNEIINLNYPLFEKESRKKDDKFIKNGFLDAIKDVSIYIPKEEGYFYYFYVQLFSNGLLLENGSINLFKNNSNNEKALIERLIQDTTTPLTSRVFRGETACVIVDITKLDYNGDYSVNTDTIKLSDLCFTTNKVNYKDLDITNTLLAETTKNINITDSILFNEKKLSYIENVGLYEGYVLGISGKIGTTSNNRALIFFPIEKGTIYNLEIPMTGNEYCSVYAFSNEVSVSQITSNTYGIGNEKEFKSTFTNTTDYKYLVVCYTYTATAGKPTLESIEFDGLVDMLTDDVDLIKLDINGGEGVRNIEISETFNNVYLSTGGTIVASSNPRSISYFPISSNKIYDLYIPRTGNSYACKYAFSNTMVSSGNLYNPYGVGDEREFITTIDTTDNSYKYLVVCYTYTAGTPILKEHGVFDGIKKDINDINTVLNEYKLNIDVLESLETINTSFISSDGTIKSSSQPSTTVDIYDIVDSKTLIIEMQTGNSYTSPYKFYDSNDNLVVDDNEFPTIEGNGIYLKSNLNVPKGASKLKITYNKNYPHSVSRLGGSIFATNKDVESLELKYESSEQNILNVKDGLGIIYRDKSKDRKRTLKILGVGNSWTLNATLHLGEILLGLGVDVEIHVSYAGGETLNGYYNNLKTNAAKYEHRIWKKDTGWFSKEGLSSYKDIFLSNDWDIVTHQQQSANGGNYSSFQPYLHEIIQWEKKASKIMPLFFMHATWAYPNGYENSQFEELYNSDSDTMYNAILEAYNQAMIDENIVNVMPSAPMIQQVRTLGIPSIDTDDGGSHLNNGCYAVSSVWGEMLLRNYFYNSTLSVVDSTYYPSGWSASIAKQVRELAKEIVANVKNYFPNQE